MGQTGFAAVSSKSSGEGQGDLSSGADDRFREMFYEEARELLISLEEGLMDLERRQSDRAHLDKTFRAAHSLKGAAAMVGLGAIAEFTHGIEAVLERIRARLAAGRFRHHHDLARVARSSGGHGGGRGGQGRRSPLRRAVSPPEFPLAGASAAWN